MEKEVQRTPPVFVPVERLNNELIDSLLDSFILREGTDYGSVEATMETKRRQLRTQLSRGDILIAFDPDSDSVTLLTKHDWQRLSAKL